MAHQEYYGAHVRIEYRGTGLDGKLVVQKENPIGGGWMDVKTFNEYSSYCHTEAKQYAASLSYCLQQGETEHIQRSSVWDSKTMAA
jgi:hypothetical protein